MKLYLNVIRGELEIRAYKTKKCIFCFDSKNVMKWASGREGHHVFYNINTNCNDIYLYLVHAAKVIYTDDNGRDRLTLKGLEMYWKDKYIKQLYKSELTETEYRNLLESAF
jgi:hypothetical protein